MFGSYDDPIYQDVLDLREAVALIVRAWRIIGCLAACDDTEAWQWCTDAEPLLRRKREEAGEE